MNRSEEHNKVIKTLWKYSLLIKQKIDDYESLNYENLTIP